MQRSLKSALVALFLIALVLPVLYFGFSQGVHPSPRDYRYSSTGESAPDAETILTLLGKFMNPEQLGLLQSMIGHVAQLPKGKQTPLVAYFDALERLANNMDEIKSKLDDAQSSLASGNRAQAIVDLEQLRALRNRTRPLFNSLPGLLQKVADSYEIDTTAQSQKLKDLEAQFSSYSRQIDALSDKLAKQGALAETVLWANSSISEIFIGDTFFIYGALSTLNGTALSNRNLTVALLTGEMISMSTDTTGAFNSTIILPVGFPSGRNEIGVAYNPTGTDVEVYLPSSTVVEVSVAYRPSTLTLSMIPDNPYPLDIVALTGDLKDPSEGTPLANRTVMVELDGNFWGKSTTNAIGAFSFNVMIPDAIGNGTHRFDVTFPGDKYAPSNATISFDIALLQSRISITADRTSLLSGMRLTVSGDVLYLNSSTTAVGSVAVFVDNARYSNVTLGANGTFTAGIQIPIFLSFGAHEVRVEFTPGPGVQTSFATLQVFVYNTLVIAVLLVGVSTASSVTVYVLRRRRRLAIATTPSGLLEQMTVQEPVAVRPSVEELVRTVESYGDHAAKVSKCYRLARSLIDSKSGEEGHSNETHLEYSARVSETMPYLRDYLKQLVELFEVAEYSQYSVGPDASKKALEILLKIHEVTS